MTLARPIVAAAGLVKHFPVGSRFFGRSRNYIAAVDDCDFSLAAGETLGVVGESGCGKSTIALQLLGFRHVSMRVEQGEVRFKGQALTSMSRWGLPFARWSPTTITGSTPRSI